MREKQSSTQLFVGAQSLTHNVVSSHTLTGFHYTVDELSTEDNITMCIIESYLDFKVTQCACRAGILVLLISMYVYKIYNRIIYCLGKSSFITHIHFAAVL